MSLSDPKTRPKTGKALLHHPSCWRKGAHQCGNISDAAKPWRILLGAMQAGVGLNQVGAMMEECRWLELTMR